RTTYEKQWSLVKFPSSFEAATGGEGKGAGGVVWYRCAVRIPRNWIEPQGLTLALPKHDGSITAWLNGEPLDAASASSRKDLRIPTQAIAHDGANLLVLRVERKSGDKVLAEAPKIIGPAKTLSLEGRWQFRIGDNPDWSNIPLPARYGASPD